MKSVNNTIAKAEKLIKKLHDIKSVRNPPTRYVVCAAIYFKTDDIVIPSARHYDATMSKIIKALDIQKPRNEVQGFIDQFGVFMDRKEAMEVVKATGQKFDPDRNGHPASDLYSEGLY